MPITPCDPCDCVPPNIGNDKFKQDVETLLCNTLTAMGYTFPAKGVCNPCLCIQGNIPNDKFKQDVEVLLCAIIEAAGLLGGGITELTGDVTATGPGVVAATIANQAVTFAKMQNIATARLLGRSTAGSGSPEELTVGTGLSLAAGVLSSTGGMAIGGTVTGATAGSLLFANAGPVLAQDNANLFWDDTNNRLGLGTNAPGRILDIAANGRCRLEPGIGSGFWYNGAASTDRWFVGTDGTASDYFRFYMGANALSLASSNISNPQHQFFQELALTAGQQIFLNLSAFVNQAATAGYTILKTTVTESATGSGTKNLLDLECAGTSRFSVERGRYRVKYNAVSADTTLDDQYSVVTVDASGGNKTITLPAASGITGAVYTIKKIDATGNTVTVDGNASETIDGATTNVLSAQYKAITIQCDGSNWFIIAQV